MSDCSSDYMMYLTALLSDWISIVLIYRAYHCLTAR